MSQRMAKMMLKIFLLLSLASHQYRSEVLQGPGSNARIIPFSERIAPDELPVEHRGGGGLLLPDVFSVSRNITSELDVDLFFSLFFVFLNDQFEESDAPFAIFAPAGLATSEATRWLRTEKELTEELLLNHIVMGDHLRPELVTSWNVVRNTLGGLEVSFKVDDDGELWVNDARIVAWKEEGNALIIALEDYLFKTKVQQEVSITDIGNSEIDETFIESEMKDTEQLVPREWGNASEELEASSDSSRVQFIPTPRKSHKNCTKVENKSGLSIFKTITVCTETVDVANITDEKDLEPALRRLDSSLSFLKEVEKELSFIRGAPGLTYFLSYANKSGLDQLLSPKQTYTVLAPVDEAFQSWQPIDWGFNPFDVPSFVNVTLANHVIEGAVVQPDSEQSSLTTIGAREVVVTVRGENTYANGVLVRGGITLQGGRGSVLFLDKVLWVDHHVVDELNTKFGFLESGPPINSPWNNSQFLSQSLIILEKMSHTILIAQYMNATPTLGDLAPSVEGSGYTLFAPSDEAFATLCFQEGQRTDLLAGHLVDSRLVLSDNNDTSVIRTMAGRNITLLPTPAGTMVLDDGSPEGPAAIIGDPTFVYDLGTLIVIDKVLLGSEVELPHTKESQETTPAVTEAAITTTVEPLDKREEDKSEEKVKKVKPEEISLLNSFMTSDSDIISGTSDDTTDIDAFIKFPETETNELDDIETTTSQEYSASEDTTAPVTDDEEDTTADTSMIVFQVNKLVTEEQLGENLLLGPDELPRPRERRVVYINNRRVEIQEEQLL